MKPEQEFTEYLESMLVTVQHECRVCGAWSRTYGICPDCQAMQQFMIQNTPQEGEADQVMD